jgi:hypothetical protein
MGRTSADAEIQALTVEQSFAQVFEKGTVLWRSCSFKSLWKDGKIEDRLEVADGRPEATDGLSFVRLDLWNRPFPEPECYGGRESKGIIVFINGKLSPDWTALRVSGQSRSMRGASILDTTGSLFATPLKGAPSLEEYKGWRRRVHKQVKEDGGYHPLNTQALRNYLDHIFLAMPPSRVAQSHSRVIFQSYPAGKKAAMNGSAPGFIFSRMHSNASI